MDTLYQEGSSFMKKRLICVDLRIISGSCARLIGLVVQCPVSTVLT